MAEAVGVHRLPPASVISLGSYFIGNLKGEFIASRRILVSNLVSTHRRGWFDWVIGKYPPPPLQIRGSSCVIGAGSDDDGWRHVFAWVTERARLCVLLRVIAQVNRG